MPKAKPREQTHLRHGALLQSSRINCPQLGNILTKCFPGFFTLEEIEKGADLMMRNNFMSDVGRVPAASK